MKLDNKDKIILECLMQNCRMPVKKIAKFAHLTHPGVLYRIKKLEENKFIERYDGLIDLNKLPHKVKNFFIRVPAKKKEAFEKYCLKNKSIMSLSEHAHYFNYLVWSPFSPEDEKNFVNFLKKNKLEYQSGSLTSLRPGIFSIFDDIDIEVKRKKHKDKILKLNKTDIKIIELMNNGCGRDSILELSRKLNISADLALYRFKRLLNAGYFTNFIAHPNPKKYNIKYELVEIYAKNINLDEYGKIMDKTKRVAFYSQIGEGRFFTTLVVKSLEDMEKTIDTILKELDEKLIRIEIYLIKHFICLNRLNERSFGVED